MMDSERFAAVDVSKEIDERVADLKDKFDKSTLYHTEIGNDLRGGGVGFSCFLINLIIWTVVGYQTDYELGTLAAFYVVSFVPLLMVVNGVLYVISQLRKKYYFKKHWDRYYKFVVKSHFDSEIYRIDIREDSPDGDFVRMKTEFSTCISLCPESEADLSETMYRELSRVWDSRLGY